MCATLVILWLVCGAVAYCIEQERAKFPFDRREFAKSCAWGAAALWAVIRGG